MFALLQCHNGACSICRKKRKESRVRNICFVVHDGKIVTDIERNNNIPFIYLKAYKKINANMFLLWLY
jgi:hypothetical protein